MQLRIGLATGRVTCGVVGGVVPRYVVLGDTVGLATKLESHGVPDAIQVTDAIYQSVLLATIFAVGKTVVFLPLFISFEYIS